MNVEQNEFKFEQKDLTGHRKRIYTLDWNTIGTRLASGSVDCTIKVILSLI